MEQPDRERFYSLICNLQEEYDMLQSKLARLQDEATCNKSSPLMPAADRVWNIEEHCCGSNDRNLADVEKISSVNVAMSSQRDDDILIQLLPDLAVADIQVLDPESDTIAIERPCVSHREYKRLETRTSIATLMKSDGELVPEDAVTGASTEHRDSVISLDTAMEKNGHRREGFFMRQHWLERVSLLDEKIFGSDKRDKSGKYEILFSISRMESTRTANVEPVPTTAHSCLIHPFSNKRLAWGIASVLLLLYDLIMVPMDLCFRIDPTTPAAHLQLASRIFWSVDIVVSFMTGTVDEGRVDMRPCSIARSYLRQWFAFDFSLVLVEWITFALDKDGSETSPISMLRGCRWSRIVRLTRAFHLFQTQRLRHLMQSFFALTATGLKAALTTFELTIGLFFVLHYLACIWHLIGSKLDGGWVHNSHLADTSVGHRYAMSLHWMFVHVQADTDGIRLGTSLEYAVDAMFAFCWFVASSAYVGLCTNTVITLANSDASQMATYARRYTKRHKVSQELSRRLHHCLLSKQLGGPAELLAEEHSLISALPSRLQSDLHYEVRTRVVCNLDFLSVMHEASPRVLRALTHDSLKEFVAVADEIIWAHGDACNHVTFITKGSFAYHCDEYILQSTPRVNRRDPGKFEGCDVVGGSGVLSEAVLWSNWEHHGTLVSDCEGFFTVMNATRFGQAIIAHKRAMIHAVRYAKHFCWRLNRCEPSDVMAFDLPPEVLDTDLHIGGLEDHFAFISHYKVEAGTEATLMRDEMELVIRKDPSNPAGDFKSPIFVDSEDLVDLGRLIDHVKGSLALIVLLSPGLFTRPWCLLEIVTARRNGRPFVPVLLVRPGLSYQFPKEEFYEQLYKDEVIEGGAAGRKILEADGTTLQEVEEAIRAIFQMIALPYSPHKSATVREAEIHDILKRCSTLTAHALSELNNNATSTVDFSCRSSVTRYRAATVQTHADGGDASISTTILHGGSRSDGCVTVGRE